MMAALGAVAALPGCGFTPVHAPGRGTPLLGQVALSAPETRAGYLVTRRFEERVGIAPAPRYRLESDLRMETESLGTTADGRTTRFHLVGDLDWRLRPADAGPEPGAPLDSGRLHAFTGYSATGSTLATRAAERDAERRLATMLADQLIDRLLLSLSDRPA